MKNYTETLKDFLHAIRPYVVETDEHAHMHPRLSGYVNIRVFKVEFISKDFEESLLDEWKDRIYLLRNLPSFRDVALAADPHWIVSGIRMHNPTTPKEEKDRRAFVSWCKKRGYDPYKEMSCLI